MKMVRDLGMRFRTPNSKEKSHFAVYICPNCGKEFETGVWDVNAGHTRSCGCISGMYKHGMVGNNKPKRLYRIWMNMKQRIYRTNHRLYHRYGGRGIRLCEEWLNPLVFFEWAKSHGYNDNLQIDRINNDGDYTPENCRFVTQRENLLNKSKRENNCIYVLNSGNFVVLIRRENKRYYIGSYKTIEEAREARDRFILKFEIDKAMEERE